MKALDGLALAACLGAIGCAGVRWLRVAQREHYLAGAGARFAWRWWAGDPWNRLLALAAILGAAVSGFVPLVALVPAAVVAGGPVGLHLRGTTSRLVWTRRLRTTAVVVGLLEAVLVAGTGAAGGLAAAVVAAAAGAIAVPVALDAGLAIVRPVENWAAARHVRRARGVLERVRPVVVGVTGSYGKTSTKGYIAHLLGGARSVVASPRSFNNRAGLARTVNEHLVPGTEVLVAEMGAYGPGEIRSMCEWLRPQISVITAIGPAHLERFRTLERTLAAKAEIAEGADSVVVNVDDELLSGLADRLGARQRVVRASGIDPGADVAVMAVAIGLELRVAGKLLGEVALAPGSVSPVRTNVACAAAVALELGVPPEQVLERLAMLPVVPNRLQRYPAEAGYLVLDDTFNANPAGARLALEALSRESGSGRLVVVTPGMVELGPTQRAENAAFAEAAAATATDVVVVGRTNRRALVGGCARVERAPNLEIVRSRADAVAWARAHLGPGDAVLFENDLPDHHP